MIKTVWLTKQKDISQGVAMLLGGFDGLHLGHRRLLSHAKQSCYPVGIMSIIGGKDGNLFTFVEREDIFRKNGADFVFELPFTEIKDLSPVQFLSMLEKQFPVKLFVCGEDFRFGAGALGTPEMIKRATQVRVEVLSLVEMQGEKISSRKVKELLGEGEVGKANLLLGAPFFLTGKVVQDRQIGRTIGFPTANIVYSKEKFPLKQGVYQTQVCVDGVCYKAITNYGARPTFDNQTIITETHLDGFHGDLYGKILTIEFVRYLRDIQKFENERGLQSQLTKDIGKVRTND